MAKRRITISKARRIGGQSMHDKPKRFAKIDLCKVYPWRFKELSDTQLNKAAKRIGRLYDIPKGDRIRDAVGLFVNALRRQRAAEHPESTLTRVERDKFVADARSDVEHYEKRIIRMQGEAKRPLSSTREMVARDMEETKKYGADEIDYVRRGKRRPRLR